MTCKTLESDLEKFRVAYPSVRCFVDPNCIVYKTKRGGSDEAARRANTLIEELGLPLVAIGTSFNAKDSFVVQSNETDSI